MPRRGRRRHRPDTAAEARSSSQVRASSSRHAASAYYPSGFDAAAILVVDGIGEVACSTLARGEGARIETIETFSYSHSLGFVWEHASVHLGFSPYDASKVMGLAAYGDPDVYRRELATII